MIKQNTVCLLNKDFTHLVASPDKARNLSNILKVPLVAPKYKVSCLLFKVLDDQFGLRIL